MTDRQNRLWTALAIFAAGFLLRFLPLFFNHSIAHPDEVFQALEQGHRLVFGYGFVPWEFDYHARSWAMAVMSAGGMELGKWLGGGPQLYLPLVTASFAALGATSTLCVFAWGRRVYGPAGGAAVALVSASWVDNVFFGGRSLSEPVAAHLLILAVYFGLHPSAARWRWVAGGFFAGAAIALRLQLGPAAALLWIWPGGWKQRFWFLTLGAALAFAADGALDLATGSAFPFEPQWQNVRFNLLMGGSVSAFGSDPWHHYIVLMASNWGAAFVLLTVLALLGARRMPILLAMAAVILLVHIAIGHKEYRFIYPAIAMTSILAGFGLVELTRLIANGVGGETRAAPLWLAVVVGLCWTGIAALTVAGRDYHDFWRVSQNVTSAELYVSKLPGLCGLGHNKNDRYLAGGYVFLHRRVLIIRIADGDADAAQRFAAANMLIEDMDRPHAIPAEFVRKKCFDSFCVFERPGACAALPPEPRPTMAFSTAVATQRYYPRIEGVH